MKLQAVYKTIDTTDIDADVYLPSGDENRSQKCPVVINIHGGAFMLGAAGMVNVDQIQECLGRGWIVVAPNHRLCPQVSLLDGPMQDCRDLLEWIYYGKLDDLLGARGFAHVCDLEHVFAFGTSSGGHLALSLGFDVRRPVAGIFDMYGPCNFTAAFWSTSIPSIASRLPDELDQEMSSKVFSENPIPIRGGVSLEGQAPGPPDFSDPRQAFAFWHIGNGKMMNVLAPSQEWDKVDPIRNITSTFPPVYIVHGQEDFMVPMRLSEDLLVELRKHGVKSGLTAIPGEGHTFAAKMQRGSQTWNLHLDGFNFLQSLVNTA